MANNKNVEINYYVDINPENGGGSGEKPIRWFLDENGNPTLLETLYEPVIVPSNPNKDTIPPQANLSISDSSFFNSEVNLEYLVKENQTLLDTAYYELNGVKKNIECSVPYYAVLAPVDSISATIPLTSKEGEHDLVFYANDIAKPQGNETIKNIKFFIDKTPPQINIIYPQPLEYLQVDSIIFSTSDSYLDSCWFSVDAGQTKQYFPSSSGYTDILHLNSVEGINTWSLYTKDKAGNQSNEKITFTIDKTAPIIQILYPENADYVGDVTELIFTISDETLDSCFYSIDSGQTKEYFQWLGEEQFTLNLNAEIGLNTWTIYAKDKAGNESTQSITFNIVPDAVKESSQKPLFEIYPNPFDENAKIEYTLTHPDDVVLVLYDINGRTLKTIAQKNQAPGTHMIYIDELKFPSGMYFIQLRTRERCETRLMIKK